MPLTLPTLKFRLQPPYLSASGGEGLEATMKKIKDALSNVKTFVDGLETALSSAQGDISTAEGAISAFSAELRESFLMASATKYWALSIDDTGAWVITHQESDVVTIETSDEAVVTALDSEAGTLTVANATTAGGLEAVINSTDITTQSYAVEDSLAAPVADGTALTTGDTLTVTAEDGAATKVYTITVEAA